MTSGPTIASAKPTTTAQFPNSPTARRRSSPGPSTPTTTTRSAGNPLPRQHSARHHRLRLRQPALHGALHDARRTHTSVGRRQANPVSLLCRLTARPSSPLDGTSVLADMHDADIAGGKRALSVPMVLCGCTARRRRHLADDAGRQAGTGGAVRTRRSRSSAECRWPRDTPVAPALNDKWQPEPTDRATRSPPTSSHREPSYASVRHRAAERDTSPTNLSDSPESLSAR